MTYLPGKITVEWYREQLEYPYAWPGGYPRYLVMHDGGDICMNCAKEMQKEIEEAITEQNTWDQWFPEDFDVNWEDTDLTCDHCYAHIESAYGDD